VRRPSGRALFQQLAADPRAIVLKTGSLNRAAQIAAARAGSTGHLTFGQNTFRDPVSGNTSVTLDKSAIQEFARKSGGTADPVGITNMAHELWHADKALNATRSEWAAGDKPTNDTGPAQLFAESAYREATDMNFSSAAAIVSGGFSASPVLGSSWNLTEPFFAGSVCLEGICVAPMDLSRY